MYAVDLTSVSAYAGVAADDPRGQWTTADLAQWCYSSTDEIVQYDLITPGDEAYLLERADGNCMAFCLEHDDAGNIDGWTFTLYDRDGDECSTGGDPITYVSDLWRALLEIIDWADSRA